MPKCVQSRGSRVRHDRINLPAATGADSLPVSYTDSAIRTLAFWNNTRATWRSLAAAIAQVPADMSPGSADPRRQLSRTRVIDMRAFAYGHDWSNSQADSAGSIPVTRSAGNPGKRGLLSLCLDRSRGWGQLTRDPRGRLGSGEGRARPRSHNRKTWQRGARRPWPSRPRRALRRAQCPPGTMTASRWTRQLVTVGAVRARSQVAGPLSAINPTEERSVEVDRQLP